MHSNAETFPSKVSPAHGTQVMNQQRYQGCHRERVPRDSFQSKAYGGLPWERCTEQPALFSGPRGSYTGPEVADVSLGASPCLQQLPRSSCSHRPGCSPWSIPCLCSPQCSSAPRVKMRSEEKHCTAREYQWEPHVLHCALSQTCAG